MARASVRSIKELLPALSGTANKLDLEPDNYVVSRTLFSIKNVVDRFPYTYLAIHCYLLFKNYQETLADGLSGRLKNDCHSFLVGRSPGIYIRRASDELAVNSLSHRYCITIVITSLVGRSSGKHMRRIVVNELALATCSKLVDYLTIQVLLCLIAWGIRGCQKTLEQGVWSKTSSNESSWSA